MSEFEPKSPGREDEEKSDSATRGDWTQFNILHQLAGSKNPCQLQRKGKNSKQRVERIPAPGDGAPGSAAQLQQLPGRPGGARPAP